MYGDNGARHDRVSIKDEIFFEMPVHLPCNEEQEKIATFLSLLEQKIELQRVLVDNLKKYKRGLHLRVFNKMRKPYWNKSNLRDIAVFCGGGTPSKDIPSYWTGNIGWISSSDLQEEWIDTISITRRINKTAIDNSATKVCPKGSITIVSRVGVGKVAVMPEALCTSQDFINITAIEGNPHFMAYQIAYKMKTEAAKTQGTAIKGITVNAIKSMEIDIPPMEEQYHIAKMLSAFDNRLRREVQKLDNLSKVRKALLQYLFI